MSKVRVLVGTKKGGFVLTSDGKRKKWKVSGPHFPGWEIYHMKGSPADPDRLMALAEQWNLAGSVRRLIDAVSASARSERSEPRSRERNTGTDAR